MAVAWVLAQPQVAGVIVGARNAGHLADTTRAASLVLDGDDEATLHERIKIVERRLLVDVLSALASGGVTWIGRKATLG